MKVDKESDFFKFYSDFWAIVKDIHDPIEKPDYWTQIHHRIVALSNKYPNMDGHYLLDVATAYGRLLDREKERGSHNGND